MNTPSFRQIKESSVAGHRTLRTNWDVLVGGTPPAKLVQCSVCLDVGDIASPTRTYYNDARTEVWQDKAMAPGILYLKYSTVPKGPE